MPFLRVVRDKRGYETTYLLHWYQDGQRPRSRVLHVFRTPAGVRVGRDPFDPELLREIEALHPDIEFDWAALRGELQIIDSAPEVRRRRPKRESPSETPAAAPIPPGVEAHEPARAAEPASTEPAAARPARPPIPAALQGETPAEQIAFLQEWYPKIVERIPRYTSDPGRQQALLALAERLNPNGWIDADAITAGLQDAAEALERLSRVFARRRRRRRERPPSSNS